MGARRGAAFGGLFGLDADQPLVEEKLVTRRGEQRGGRSLDPDPDHPPVELPQFVHERSEVAVAGAEHERRDVVPFERQFDRVHSHLDVRRVLAYCTHSLRHLDELDLMAREHAPVFLEVRPIGVRAPDHHSTPFRERVGDGPEVERAPELFTRSDGEVLVVEEERDAFVVTGHEAIVTW